MSIPLLVSLGVAVVYVIKTYNVYPAVGSSFPRFFSQSGFTTTPRSGSPAPPSQAALDAASMIPASNEVASSLHLDAASPFSTDETRAQVGENDRPTYLPFRCTVAVQGRQGLAVTLY